MGALPATCRPQRYTSAAYGARACVPSWRCAAWLTKWVIGSGSIGRICRENQTLCLSRGGRCYLFTDVSGTPMSARLRIRQNRMPITGGRSLSVIRPRQKEFGGYHCTGMEAASDLGMRVKLPSEACKEIDCLSRMIDCPVCNDGGDFRNV